MKYWMNSLATSCVLFIIVSLSLQYGTHHIDLFCRTETRLSNDDYISLNESTPPSHINTPIPRDIGRGGGVVAIFDLGLLINPKPKLN